MTPELVQDYPARYELKIGRLTIAVVIDHNWQDPGEPDQWAAQVPGPDGYRFFEGLPPFTSLRGCVDHFLAHYGLPKLKEPA